MKELSPYRRIYKWKYSLREWDRIIYKKIRKKRKSCDKYAGRKILDIEEGNQKLCELIQGGNPFLVMRYGCTELRCTVDPILYGKYRPITLPNIVNCSGFFPNSEEHGYRFMDLMLDLSREIDVAALYYSFGEEFVLGEYAKQAVLVHNRAIEPWYISSQTPWTSLLKGKKVLVIHPFVDTIAKQYEKRELLFPGTNILPEFDLKLQKAVQTITGIQDERFADWFEALDYMVDEAGKVDFDIAIIGCGAYGFPLAARIKQMGKQAIHLGGATQILFGIKGARWDHHPVISKLYNEAWVRPNAEETPQRADSVEGACYW